MTFDSFVDFVCYHHIVSNVTSIRFTSLSARRSCSSVGEVGGWKWKWGKREGPLGLGKEQVGRVSSKHSSIDSGWFDPRHARAACAHACVRT